MDPVDSLPYEKRVDIKHDVLWIYTHVHQNISRSHDEIGTLHVHPRRPANCPHCKFWMADSIPTTRKASAGPSRGKTVKFLSLNYI